MVLVLTSIAFVAAPSMIKKTVLHRFDPTQSETMEKYSSGRLRIWRNSLELFAERPIFGHGPRTVANLMEMRFNEVKVAHNQYLNYLVEQGIIGFSLFIMIFLKIFQVMWHYEKNTPDLWQKKLYISYIAGLIGYAFSMLFINLTEPRYVFWFYTAVFHRYGQLQKIAQE